MDLQAFAIDARIESRSERFNAPSLWLATSHSFRPEAPDTGFWKLLKIRRLSLLYRWRSLQSRLAGPGRPGIRRRRQRFPRPPRVSASRLPGDIGRGDQRADF